MNDLQDRDMPAPEHGAWQRFLEESLAQRGDWRRVARIERVLQMAAAGIALDTEAVGYHGTNLGALTSLIDTGCLPPGRERDNVLKQGYIHFVPNRAYYLAHGLEVDCVPPSEALEGAESYAAISSGRLYLLTELGLSLESEQHCAFAEELLAPFSGSLSVNPAYAELASEIERPLSELESLAQTASAKKGVVLAFSPAILGTFAASPSDEEELGGVRIFAPDGVPLDMISGIRLLGDEERNFVAKLGRLIG